MQEEWNIKLRLCPSSPSPVAKLALSPNQDGNTCGISPSSSNKSFQNLESYEDVQMKNSCPESHFRFGEELTPNLAQVPDVYNNGHLSHSEEKRFSTPLVETGGKVLEKRRRTSKNKNGEIMKTHRKGGGTHSCSTCGRTFGFRTNLLTHMRTHTGERPFKCTLCDYSAAHKCNLVTHMNIHTGAKPHKCEYCHQEFRARPNLIVHIRQHTRDLPFKCDKCECSFASQGAMKGHILRHHSPKTFQCPFCDKKFRQQAHLNTHIGRHDHANDDTPQLTLVEDTPPNSSGKYECEDEECSEEFSTSRDRRRHAMVHTLEKQRHTCGICGVTFENGDQLVIHSLIHCTT